MGRVEDAMRRAAEEKTAASVAGLGVVEEAETLVDAAFPAELVELPAERRAETSDDSPHVVADLDGASSSLTFNLPAPGLAFAVRTHEAKLIADETMAPVSREQYRRLAATLHHTQMTSGLKVVMIASAVASEGKTLTAANLALTFSESYHRSVLLIDADLRRPSLHTVFRVDATPGLSDDLMAASPTKLPVHRLSERLSVLTGGRPTSDPMAGLTSNRMRRLIEDARAAFDWVIIDTPPVGLMTDASLLAAMTDGTVMVVKAGSTPYPAVQRAIDALGRGRLLGAVLNRANLGTRAGNKYYDYYYGPRSATVAGK